MSEAVVAEQPRGAPECPPSWVPPGLPLFGGSQAFKPAYRSDFKDKPKSVMGLELCNDIFAHPSSYDDETFKIFLRAYNLKAREWIPSDQMEGVREVIREIKKSCQSYYNSGRSTEIYLADAGLSKKAIELYEHKHEKQDNSPPSYDSKFIRAYTVLKKLKSEHWEYVTTTIPKNDVLILERSSDGEGFNSLSEYAEWALAEKPPRTV